MLGMIVLTSGLGCRLLLPGVGALPGMTLDNALEAFLFRWIAQMATVFVLAISQLLALQPEVSVSTGMRWLSAKRPPATGSFPTNLPSAAEPR